MLLPTRKFETAAELLEHYKRLREKSFPAPPKRVRPFQVCGCGHPWERHTQTFNGAFACTHHGCGCRDVVGPRSEISAAPPPPPAPPLPPEPSPLLPVEPVVPVMSQQPVELPPYAPALGIVRIRRAVGAAFDVPDHIMTSASRAECNLRPRQIGMALARHLTNATLPEIGRKFDRDHTTVMNAIVRMEPMIAELARQLPPDAPLEQWIEAAKLYRQRTSIHDSERRRERTRERRRRQRELLLVQATDAGCSEPVLRPMPAPEPEDQA